MNKTFRRKWIQLSLIWIVIALVPVGRVYLYFTPIEAWFYIVVLLIGLFLCPFLLLWINFLQKRKQSWIRIIFIQILFSILLAIIFHYATEESPRMMKRRMSPNELKQMPATQQASFHFFSGNSYTIFTSLMILSGLALLIDYNEQLRQRKNRELQLQADLALSQIKALQSELQPHFLFNTLHSVNSLMEIDINKAQLLIEKLSFLLRNYLDIINRNFYSLSEEIEFLKKYIEVQQLRHNGTIEFDLQITNNCLKYEVPVILLQPIIENSIKHGWTNRQIPLHLLIKAECENEKLHIKVQDNGKAITSSDGSGIGIRNLKERLSVLYNSNFSFSEKNNNGYFSHLVLPIKR